MEFDSSSNDPQRVQDLWFDDGNLVIQAENKHFRVFRGILAARSPVFQDMLSFPQPSDAELVEGCPLVRFPDCAWKVTVFLKAIFLPDFFKAYPAPMEFDTILGCLRLSHKYGVDYLRRTALIHLSAGYDTTLSRWDRKDVVDDNLSYGLISWGGWPDDEAHAIYFIQLAREVNALWLLPVAFYRLANTFSTDQIGRDVFHGTVWNGMPASLSVLDQEAFLKGYNIQSRSTWAILRFLSRPQQISGCQFSAGCLAARLSVLENIQSTIHNGPYIPLDIWGEDEWEMLDEYEMCFVCFEVLRKIHTAARQAFWDALPQMYGLPPWEELEEKRTATIGTEWLR
ncbi:hypothetical protein C8R43DRAFT_1039923 [Mycena crocata]|nr:hypothetical protein C8R43DRAFT_1039923 [Mycena crocata]